jgi:hypothetical protein
MQKTKKMFIPEAMSCATHGKQGLCQVPLDETHGKPNLKKILRRVLQIRHTATFESMLSVGQQGTRQNIFIKKT